MTIQLTVITISTIAPGLVRIVSDLGSVVELTTTGNDGTQPTQLQPGDMITAWCSVDGVARRWTLDT